MDITMAPIGKPKKKRVHEEPPLEFPQTLPAAPSEPRPIKVPVPA